MPKSYCKINLFLRVNKKLKNKLHNIQTVSFLLNLYDRIEVKKIKNNRDLIVFKGPFKRLISKGNNTIAKTLLFLRKKELINKNNKYKIIIFKNIPVFSGLGGGTSNAMTLLRYFLGKHINSKTLNSFQNYIGSDLKLFLYNKVMQKNLKSFNKFRQNSIFNFVLVYPKKKCSTKVIYSKVKNFSFPTKIDYNKASPKKFIKLMKLEKNDLQKIAISKYNVIGRVINFISIQEGCYISRMTGSGSVCFGMFKSKKSAIKAKKIIKRHFPKYWCVFARTI